MTCQCKGVMVSRDCPHHRDEIGPHARPLPQITDEMAQRAAWELERGHSDHYEAARAALRAAFNQEDQP